MLLGDLQRGLPGEGFPNLFLITEASKPLKKLCLGLVPEQTSIPFPPLPQPGILSTGQALEHLSGIPDTQLLFLAVLVMF